MLRVRLKPVTGQAPREARFSEWQDFSISVTTPACPQRPFAHPSSLSLRQSPYSLVPSLERAVRVGHSWGRGGGLRKGGPLLWLSVSLWSLFSLKGDQMQWAGQSESIHGSQHCFREHVEFYDQRHGPSGNRKFTWTFGPSDGLASSSVESLSTFGFPHDFMRVQEEVASCFLPSSVCAIVAKGSLGGIQPEEDGTEVQCTLSFVHVGSCRNCRPRLQGITLGKHLLLPRWLFVTFPLGFCLFLRESKEGFSKAPRQTSFLCVVVDNLQHCKIL